MKLAIALAGLMSFTLPTLALAQACDHGKRVLTCAEGMKLDTNSGTCVPDVTA